MRLAALPILLAALAAPTRAGEIDFNRDIRPVLLGRCAACHGPDPEARKASLRLDTRDGAIEAGALVPGKPGESELVARVNSNEPAEVMPPPKSGPPLTPREKRLLADWVAAGGDYAEH